MKPKQKTLDKIWTEISEDSKPQDKPQAYIVCGQPGAGKSRAVEKIYDELDNKPIVIDIDKFREKHPHFEQLVEKHGVNWTDPKVTGNFAWEVRKDMVNRAMGGQYNVVIESTLRNSNDITKDLNQLKANGYETQVLIQTCPKEISEKNVVTRYEEQKTAGKLHPRSVPKEVHDHAVANLPINTDRLYLTKIPEILQVKDRNFVEYNSKEILDSFPSEVVKKILHQQR